MKKCNSLLLITLAAFFVSFITSFAQNPVQLLYQSSQGRDFWFAIPPNEADGQPVGNTQEISIDIYVTSQYTGNVTLEIPGLNYKIVKPVDANKVTTFTTPNQETSFVWEIRESEKIMDMAIHVYADEPVSVYVMNHRKVTSDGFLAIPTHSCGTDYIHLAYYDFFEQFYSSNGERRGAGFLIVANEDSTVCDIKLNGVGRNEAKTLGGHKIGDSWSVTLNKGQVYCVMGDGTTRGLFDISGSRVKSNKPVSFISFHKRTIIPSFDMWNGRDHLSEMLPPVSAWGKKYSTVELKRKDHGDFFRIIASEDSTHFTVKWYDLKSKELIGQRSGTLKSGEFKEYTETYVPRNTVNQISSIKGTSVWEADKPVLVMQYAYSADWDNASEFDPFYVTLLPDDYYITSTVFQIPAEGSTFNTNWLNIVAVGDTTDPENENLKSIKLDNKYLWQIEPGFTNNRIPGTNMYWAKIDVKPGSHILYGNTKFMGYVYGFSDFNSYGWPLGMTTDLVDNRDKNQPKIEMSEQGGAYNIHVTELQSTTDDKGNVIPDQGLSHVLLLDASYNTEVIYPTTAPQESIIKDYTFKVRNADVSKPAKAVISVTDIVGNVAVKEIEMPAFSSAEDNTLDYGLSFDIEPNPASGDMAHIKYSLSQPMAFTIEIFDITGKKVYENSFSADKGAHSINIDINKYLPGVYQAVLKTGSQNLNRKFVISK